MAKKYDDSDRFKVIDSFKKTPNKTEKEIAEELGYNKHFVNATLTNYWKFKSKLMNYESK